MNHVPDATLQAAGIVFLPDRVQIHARLYAAADKLIAWQAGKLA